MLKYYYARCKDQKCYKGEFTERYIALSVKVSRSCLLQYLLLLCVIHTYLLNNFGT
jgi:hypothetical protein